MAAVACLSGKRLLSDDDVQSNIQLIPDTARDKENIDIDRVQKYFNDKGWLAVLNVLSKKDDTKWCCSFCNKVISDDQESIACDRCLLWFHFSCTSLKKNSQNQETGFVSVAKQNLDNVCSLLPVIPCNANQFCTMS